MRKIPFVAAPKADPDLLSLAKSAHETYCRPLDKGAPTVQHDVMGATAVVSFPHNVSGVFAAVEYVYQLYHSNLIACDLNDLPRLPRVLQMMDKSKALFFPLKNARLGTNPSENRVEIQLTRLPRDRIEIARRLQRSIA